MEPILNKKQSNFPNSINQNSTQLTTKEAGNQNKEMFVCLDDNELEKITGGGYSLSGYGGAVYLIEASS
ncbi:ComC/BlpC family leader-containing pheromone/bacteriocin [Dapis sp. BLCC M172]|uniref:ComC/BlpC family leader-containing pheromone/bacteriocin n=1 Tax=Dapis sp. BLCC M172 TaxID=2975281 RepID=UPI003CF6CD73